MKSQAVLSFKKVLGLLFVLSLLALFIFPSGASANKHKSDTQNISGVTVIKGIIRDTDNKKVHKATVQVTCNGFTRTFTTGNGIYFVTFNQSECGNNSNVVVSASKGNESGSASKVIHGRGPIITANINATVMNVAVPEFSTYTMTLAVAMCAGAYLIFRKRFI